MCRGCRAPNHQLESCSPSFILHAQFRTEPHGEDIQNLDAGRKQPRPPRQPRMRAGPGNYPHRSATLIRRRLRNLWPKSGNGSRNVSYGVPQANQAELASVRFLQRTNARAYPSIFSGVSPNFAERIIRALRHDILEFSARVLAISG